MMVAAAARLTTVEWGSDFGKNELTPPIFVLRRASSLQMASAAILSIFFELSQRTANVCVPGNILWRNNRLALGLYIIPGMPYCSPGGDRQRIYRLSGAEG